MSRIQVRFETPADHRTIHTVNRLAFGRPEEGDLVDALRPVADPFLSLLAEVEGCVVGHVLFTPVSVDGGSGFLGLAPLAVHPEHQRRGIGSALVREGLAICRDAGSAAGFVLGHADYFPRFGFVPADRLGFAYDVPVPSEVFLVLELVPDGVAGASGTVRYHPEFGTVDE